ncbi:MAG TPA: hypothetical protein VMX14_03575 [Anaerolineae bacterium]|nr:hypothetical protein [Anaerolineae bacterium]HUW13354.1 hypothetical protein [Anaerolineae bacterium]
MATPKRSNIAYCDYSGGDLNFVWAWDVLDQCREANVACFLKQGSGARPGVPLLDEQGREVKQFPQ